MKFVHNHDSLVGIDSDGCVFDTMETKQKQFLHTAAIKNWELDAIEEIFRETAEYVTLYSPHRGLNRFAGLLEIMDLLKKREPNANLPSCDDLRKYVNSGLPLSNETLHKEAERKKSTELQKVLAWARQADAGIANKMGPIAPFQNAVPALECICSKSDTLVVSQTPRGILLSEWSTHGIAHLVQTISGQEQGPKTVQLQAAANEHYEKTRIMLIGDAPGDQAAAQALGACFYPIIPKVEEESWRRLYEEAYELFLANQYAGKYENQMINRFTAKLLPTPPWSA